MSPFVRSLVASAALLAAGSSMALTITSTEDLGDMTGATATVGNIFVSTDSGSDFLDTYTFTLDSSLLAGTWSTIELSLPSAGSLSLTGLTATLTQTSGGSFSQVFTGTAVGAGVTLVSFSEALAAGSYTLEITGHVAGTLGGSYAGTLQSISTVPEPSSYALASCGIAALGWMARRRRKTTESEQA